MIELFEGVCDAVYIIINKKGVIYYGIVVVFVCIIKVIFDDENVVFLFLVF